MEEDENIIYNIKLFNEDYIFTRTRFDYKNDH